ncbi:VOC family protein [Streptomyces sp. NPDC058955]|uniref:VOC family protein n=1 Tax=unclassified Streptomyces TaxID=2593676 RepID=UPI0036487D84
MNRPTHGTLHHVEIWVPDLDRALASLGWLLETLGYTVSQSWATGRGWLLGPTYVVLEQSPALTADRHDRLRPGLNHLAFHIEDAAAVEKLAAEAAEHGWQLMFPDLHPHAGGAEQYAAYLENDDGFEVELVAIPGSGPWV